MCMLASFVTPLTAVAYLAVRCLIEDDRHMWECAKEDMLDSVLSAVTVTGVMCSLNWPGPPPELFGLEFPKLFETLLLE
jgi:hypothetical protein